MTRSVRFDQGGELGKNKKVTALWEAAGYEVETTAPDSSNEIGMVERPHCTIANAIRSMSIMFAIANGYDSRTSLMDLNAATLVMDTPLLDFTNQEKYSKLLRYNTNLEDILLIYIF